MRRCLAGLAIGLFAVCMVPTSGDALTVTFYTDRAAFESELSSFSVIDFEGIVGWNEYTDYNISMTDVDFTGSALRVVGTWPPGGWYGAPYASAHLTNSYNATITADLTTAGSGFNAVGGWFGEAVSNKQTTLTLNGTGGVLDTRIVTAGDMGEGSHELFYGWIVDGDEITSVSHDVEGGYEGIDDFTYGYAVIPEPGTGSLLGLGLLGFLGCGRHFRKA